MKVDSEIELVVEQFNIVARQAMGSMRDSVTRSSQHKSDISAIIRYSIEDIDV